MENTDSRRVDLIKDAVYCFISPEAEVLDIENKLMELGSQAVELMRHKVRLRPNRSNMAAAAGLAEVSLVTKQATFVERSALSRLFSQAANVPFSLSGQPLYESRCLLCIEDVDCRTDYSRLDTAVLQDKELRALAYIHYANMGCRCDLPWLPEVDEAYIAEMIGSRWRPAWEEAKQNPDFTGTFGTEIIDAIEDAAVHIVQDMEPVIADAATFTMIHNDLNPGNVLVHDNREVYFIDWEEARYGSLFMDIPMRCGNRQQAETYRGYLGFFGCEIPQERYARLYSIASRFLGLRFMGWNLREWQHNEQARHGLIKYMEMVMYPLFG